MFPICSPWLSDSKTFFVFSLALLFPVKVKFYPPPKSKGSPLRVKNKKNCWIVDFDSSKEGFWCTECNAKNLSSLQCTVCEKIKKNWPKWSTIVQMVKKLPFLPVFLAFLRNVTFQRAGVFCVVFTASKPFFWAIKIHNPTTFLIFHPKGGPLWFRGGVKFYLHDLKWSKFKNKTCFGSSL